MNIVGRILMNVVLAFMLALMLGQSVPGLPAAVSWRAHWLGNKLGAWQDGWSMFAPDPDSMNHHIRAVIRYADGRTVTWDAPRWSERSLWRKFTGARELEYFDAVEASFNEPALDGLADYLARIHRDNPEPVGRPKHVEIWMDIYNHNHPDKDGWKPVNEPIPLSRSTLLWERDYP